MPRTIDMTPTWGEIGLIFIRIAMSNEQKALKAGRPEIARAFAMAEALSNVWGELTDEQRTRLEGVIEREQQKGMR